MSESEEHTETEKFVVPTYDSDTEIAVKVGPDRVTLKGRYTDEEGKDVETAMAMDPDTAYELADLLHKSAGECENWDTPFRMSDEGNLVENVRPPERKIDTELQESSQ